MDENDGSLRCLLALPGTEPAPGLPGLESDCCGTRGLPATIEQSSQIQPRKATKFDVRPEDGGLASFGRLLCKSVIIAAVAILAAPEKHAHGQ